MEIRERQEGEVIPMGVSVTKGLYWRTFYFRTGQRVVRVDMPNIYQRESDISVSDRVIECDVSPSAPAKE